MSSPKHLWSGDWEDESQAAQSSLPAPPPPPEPEPPPPPEPQRSPAELRRRIVALTVISALVIVGVVYAITSGGSNETPRTIPTATAVPGPHSGTATTPGTQPPPTTTTTATRPAAASQADALGLQLALVPVNRVIVQAVVPGSPADQVGIGAGALLLTINGQHVTSPGQANEILSKLPKGARVTLNLVQGSAQIQATIQESNGP